MTILPFDFDPTQFDPSQGAGQLPVGRHVVIIESSEISATKSGNGGYLQLNLRVIDGDAKGVSGPFRLNLFNSSDQTVHIAKRQLATLCYAVGVTSLGSPANVSVIHNLPFQVEVGHQNNNAKYTEIKKIYRADGSEPSQASVANAPGGSAWASPQAPQPQQVQQPQVVAQQEPVQQQFPWGPAQQPQQPQQTAPANNPPWGQQAATQQPATNGAPPWGQAAQVVTPQQPQQPQQAPSGNVPPWGQR